VPNALGLIIFRDADRTGRRSSPEGEGEGRESCRRGTPNGGRLSARSGLLPRQFSCNNICIDRIHRVRRINHRGMANPRDPRLSQAHRQQRPLKKDTRCRPIRCVPSLSAARESIGGKSSRLSRSPLSTAINLTQGTLIAAVAAKTVSLWIIILIRASLKRRLLSCLDVFASRIGPCLARD